MQVVQTAGLPPNQGKMNLLMRGCTWNSKNALTKIVEENTTCSNDHGETMGVDTTFSWPRVGAATLASVGNVESCKDAIGIPSRACSVDEIPPIGSAVFNNVDSRFIDLRGRIN